MSKLSKDTEVYLETTSKIVGKYANESFSNEMLDVFYDYEIKSPIEQMLYIAMRSIQFVDNYEDADPISYADYDWLHGLSIWPQNKIGKYKVDFYVCYYQNFKHYKEGRNTGFKRNLAVECDSQEFHERTEEQRRYEKKRDRYFTTKGLKVFHYTGKEIKDNPPKIAEEIIKYVTDTNQ